MAFIFFLSSLPGLEVPLKFPGQDKFFHVVLYAPLGFLVAYGLARSGVGKNMLLYAFLVAALYGLSDEFHQLWVPGRDASAFDLMADGIGGFIGSYVYSKLR